MTHVLLWVLNGRIPEPCLDIDRWARWFEKADLTIAQTELMAGDVLISTRFRPFWKQQGAFKPPPMLFETIVFGHAYAGELLGRPSTRRDRIETRCYATWDEAVQEHQDIEARYRGLVDETRRAAAAAIATHWSQSPPDPLG